MRSTEGTLNVAVRADAGPAIGYGHVHRTLAVVDCLRSKRVFEKRSQKPSRDRKGAILCHGCKGAILDPDTRPLPYGRGSDKTRSKADLRACYLMTKGSDTALVEASGCRVVLLEDDSSDALANVARSIDGPLILDSYRLTERDLAHLQQAGLCTIVFDDGRRLRNHPADVVIDSAPGAQELAYGGLDSTRFCLGPAYFPLRREFVDHPRGQRSRCKVGQVGVCHMLVTFGGSDPADQTGRVLGMFAGRSHPWRVTAVLGPGYAGRAEEVASADESIEVLKDPADMASVMAGADLAICGAGGTALELAYLGVPALLGTLCEDQEAIAAALSSAGVARTVGRWEEIDIEAIWTHLNELARDAGTLASMSRAGQAMVDGCGADRIADCIVKAWDASRCLVQKR